MNHYTYLLQSRTSDMMYIGVRSCECLPEEDNYWGSSKYLPEGKGGDLTGICDKFILGRFDTRKEAVADEIRRHKINNVAKNPNFWNKSKQMTTGFDTSGMPGQFGEKNGMYGKTHTPEFCEAQRKRLLGTTHNRQTSEVREKISTSLKKYFDNNPERKLEISNKAKQRCLDKSELEWKLENDKRSKTLKEYYKTESTEKKEKRINRMMGNKNPFYGKTHSKDFECEYCGKMCAKHIYTRFHSENCKHKPKEFR